MKKQWLYSSSKYSITINTTRYHILETKTNYKAVFKGRNLDLHVEINFKKGKLYLGKFISFVEGQWQNFDNENKMEILVVFANEQAYSGYVNKDIFSIQKIHLDELPEGTVDILRKNTEEAIAKIS